MLMTRCPHCGTAFRVKPEQLRARGGRVRCGHCQAPFSALESLIDTPPAAPEISTASETAAPPLAATGAPDTAPERPQATPAEPAPEPPPRPVPLAVNSVLAKHRTSSWHGTATHELSPPMPELDPSAPPRPAYELDFDLDSDELPLSPSPATPAPTVPPEREDAARPVGADEKTTLTFDWRAGSDIPGGLGGPAEAHEAEVDLDTPDWHDSPLGAPANARVTEVALEPEESAPLASDEEPVFVTAFASPAGITHAPDWTTITSPRPDAVPGEDRFSPLPEPSFTSSEAFVSDMTEAPGEPELIEHETDEQELDEHELRGDFTHNFEWEKSRANRPAAWPWAIAVLLLLVAAIAQALLWGRHDIAREFPGTRPLFAAACEQLGCTMPWPRISKLISIDASDGHPRPGKEAQFELSATLHNRAGFSQAYPYIEVTLTDVFNRALVRRAIPPEDWLPPSLKSSQAFAPGTDVAFTIYLDAGGQAATGFNLYIFYP